MNGHLNRNFGAGILAVIIAAIAVTWPACKQGRARNLVNNLSTPHSGEEEVLPRDVLAILGVLKREKIAFIKVSAGIVGDNFVYQRLVEGGYPASIISDSAKVFVSYSSEAMPRGCGTILTEKGIRFARCR